jgi:hypothetical protein
MTQPLPSLLVLAWDDGDCGAHLPGAPAAPPTLPLVRALAAHQPLLAILPQLPEAVRTEARLAEMALAAAVPPVVAETPAAVSMPEVVEMEEIPSEGAGIAAVEPEQEIARPANAPPTVAAAPAAGVVTLPSTPAKELNNAATITPVPVSVAAPEPASRLIGLADVEFATSAVDSARADAVMEPAPNQVAARRPFVWTATYHTDSWLSPAAPYAGSSPAPAPEPASIPAPPPAHLPAAPPAPAAPVIIKVVEAQPAAAAKPDPLAALFHAPQHVFDLAFDPDPELPLMSETYAFGHSGAEPGTEEAAALNAPADDLTLSLTDAGLAPLPTASTNHLPQAPARASLTQGLAALRRPEAEGETANEAGPMGLAPERAAPTVPTLSDDLHYRIIQYARFATHLVDQQAEDFGVIYAPNWPTWLAALEIRYRLRRPLVLHLSALAIATVMPAERGWLLEVERYALRRAHTVLVATEALRQQVLRLYPLRPGQVQVVATDDMTGVQAALAAVSQAGRSN